MNNQKRIVYSCTYCKSSNIQILILQIPFFLKSRKLQSFFLLMVGKRNYFPFEMNNINVFIHFSKVNNSSKVMIILAILMLFQKGKYSLFQLSYGILISIQLIDIILNKLINCRHTMAKFSIQIVYSIDYSRRAFSTFESVYLNYRKGGQGVFL